jgi:methyltransferase
METVPCINKPRRFTVSVAVPGSIVANCQTREQKTQMAGQIARAATIYHVDEIIVYDDKLAPKRRVLSNDANNRNDLADDSAAAAARSNDNNNDNDGDGERKRFSEPNAFLARVLQFCECPQYLRRAFFPMHPDLQFAGLLAPIDAPHHVRADDHCPYREGVVLDKKMPRGSLVNCGIRGRPVA